MKKFFTTDIPTKLLSLGMAVFLWVYLVVLLNPQIETTISNIPVTYSDHSNLSKNGYIITSETVESISLKLRGSRNMISNVNKNNISAYIDLSGCSAVGSYSLPMHVRLPYDELSIIDKNPYNVFVVVDKVIEQNFDLNIITQGELQQGVHIDTIEADDSVIKVKGPSEIVKSIDMAVAYFDVDGLKDTKLETSEVLLVNSRGEKITNKFLTVDTTKTRITCSVAVEKEVPVITDNITIPDGYVVHSVLPSSITILGQKELLETIQNVQTEKFTFTEENTEPADVPVILPGDVTSKNTTVEVIIKQGESNEENN